MFKYYHKKEIFTIENTLFPCFLHITEDGVCAGVDWIKRRKRITEIMSSHNDYCNGEMTVMQQKNLKSGTAGSCSLIA